MGHRTPAVHCGTLIASFILSLTDFNLVKPEAVRFIGIDNYVHMASDPLSPGAARHAQVRAHRHPVTMCASLGAALLVNSPNLFGRNIFRTLFYMPIQIPVVASTLVWIGFLNRRPAG
jgi:multiple sugar transport system permease protein